MWTNVNIIILACMSSVYSYAALWSVSASADFDKWVHIHFVLAHCKYHWLFKSLELVINRANYSHYFVWTKKIKIWFLKSTIYRYFNEISNIFTVEAKSNDISFIDIDPTVYAVQIGTCITDMHARQGVKHFFYFTLYRSRVKIMFSNISKKVILCIQIPWFFFFQISPKQQTKWNSLRGFGASAFVRVTVSNFTISNSIVNNSIINNYKIASSPLT